MFDIIYYNTPLTIDAVTILMALADDAADIDNAANVDIDKRQQLDTDCTYVSQCNDTLGIGEGKGNI
ncbi:11818_t:CDS:2 [Funneliformis caledonium]|uniref:11818_t:CDS:1 n=1 Tax=Funneliformis caledonium TaxID=1117310 RepID=A0A9N9HES9_9GLOM|nr:11818_t:CDS:2 [Funneliformis caledonium]